MCYTLLRLVYRLIKVASQQIAALSVIFVIMSTRNSLLDHLLTIPEAQVKIFDLEWQSAFYSVFHQTRTSKLLHAFCMAPIVISLFVLTSYIGFGGHAVLPWAAGITAINGAFVLMLVSAAWYLAMDVRVGLLAIPFLISFWLTANAVNFYGGAMAWQITLGVLFLAAAIQTISHQPELVPPPHSGSAGFKQFSQWVEDTSLASRVRIALMFPLFTLLELVSSPRLFAVQLLRLMHRFGYKPELKALTEKRARRVLETGDYSTYYDV